MIVNKFLFWPMICEGPWLKDRFSGTCLPCLGCIIEFTELLFIAQRIELQNKMPVSIRRIRYFTSIFRNKE